jgi:AGCS family alanine or glycine:cation symporter
MYTDITQLISPLYFLIDILAYYAWSPLSILLLVGTGLFLSIRFNLIQVNYLKFAFNLLIFGKQDPKKSTTKAATETQAITPTNKLSGFQVLATVLSGTIGTGNIAGVATAIVLGGPGALFWMWVTGFFGMATKFTSCTLAHHFRQIDQHGNILGGPMITIKHGLGYNKLAKTFAIFMLLGTLSTGSMVQSNSIVDSAVYLLPNLVDQRLLLGIIISICTGIVILGGVSRIANVATIIVPFMAITYVSTALIILGLHYDEIPNTFKMIFEYAFSIKAVAGASFWLVIRSGVARGLFASEAGLGTAPIALATLDTKHSVEAGFIGMLSPIIDTLIICTMTGLIIISSGVYDPNTVATISGAALSQKAFETGLSCIGANSSVLAAWIVGISLTLFAYTTILTWSYYGDRCVSFLFGDKYILAYRILFSLILIIGAILKLEVVWNIADIANLGMAVPNIISVLLLHKIVIKLMKDYRKEK